MEDGGNTPTGEATPDEGAYAWVPPEDMSAKDVCLLALPEGQEILGPIATRGGRLVIGGQSGDGKTTFVMAMAAAVAHKSEFLDWHGIGGTVLIFDLEQGLRTVQRRLREAKLDQSEFVRYFRIPDGLALDTHEDQAAWVESLIVKHQPKMVILDPLYKLHGGDSNDERSMVDLMRRLDGWRDEHGFCLVIPMHLRKMDPKVADPIMDDIFGSGGLTRGAEVVLGIKRFAPGRSTLYFWKDRDGDLHEHDKWRLTFSHEDGFERVIDDTAPETTLLVERAFLGSGGGIMNLKEIQHAVGRSSRLCHNALLELEKMGKVRREDIKGARGTIRWRILHVTDEETLRLMNIAKEDWKEHA